MQMMNIADCTRGQVEQVLVLEGVTAGKVETAAYSLKPGASFKEVHTCTPVALCVLQGMGLCVVRDGAGNRAVVRLRRGTHFSVPSGCGFRFENTGRALLIVLQAAAP